MSSHPDQVIADLKGRLTSARAHANLDLIHAACRAIHGRSAGPKNYQGPSIIKEMKGLPAEVLAAAKKAGGSGPSLNTLRAKEGGQHFRELIVAWREHDQSSQVETARPMKSQARNEELLLGIDNQVVRAKISNLLADCERVKAEAAAVRAECNTLKARNNLTIDMRPIDGAALARTPGTMELLSPPPPNLFASETSALRQAIDPKYLKRMGLVIGPEGQIQSSAGQVLFAAGFATGLPKLLSLVGREDKAHVVHLGDSDKKVGQGRGGDGGEIAVADGNGEGVFEVGGKLVEKDDDGLRA